MDGLLGGLDQLIAKKRDLKQAAMQQLLTGQTRLPGFHGEWEVKTLGRCGRCSVRDSRQRLRSYQPKWMNGAVHSIQGTLTSVIGASIRRISRLTQIVNEAACASVADVGERCRAWRVSDVAWIDSRSLALQQRSCVVRRFRIDIRHSANYSQPESLEQARAFATARTVQHVIQRRRNSLADNSLASDDAEQTAIAEVLTDMDAELAALEQRRTKTRALKQAHDAGTADREDATRMSTVGQNEKKRSSAL